MSTSGPVVTWKVHPVRTRSVGLGVKLMGSFLVVDLILIAVGLFGLFTQGSLAQRISAVSSRDIVPLSHLRTAQNNNHSAVITGFATMTATDAEFKKQMQAAVLDYSKAVTEAFDLLRQTTPSAMRPQVEDLIASFDAMAKADAVYKANIDKPNAGELGKKVSDLYEVTETKFNEVASAFVKDADHQQAVTTDAYRRSRTVTLILLAAGVLAGSALAVGITRSVRRRSSVILAGLDRLAQRDLTVTVEVSGSDEIAHMAQALNRSTAAVRAALSEVNGSAGVLADSAQGLTGSTAQTAAAVEQAGQAVGSVVSSAETVTRTVDDVASSTVELAASIRDISDNAQQAARVAGNAVGVVEATNATISQLGNSSQEIGNVVQVIQNIAAQTSLLALNATIEAARAGEAGRGFAVVAGEVKDLARETAEATDSVITRVQAIQADTEGAISAIAQIGEIIQQINGFQGTIAAAVEEQSVTTDSISASIAEALQITRQITTEIEQVSTASRGGTAALSSTNTLADNVAAMGEQLRQVVSNFRL
jgi:methyl-accepting chemotaxis protein